MHNFKLNIFVSQPVNVWISEDALDSQAIVCMSAHSLVTIADGFR